MNRLYNLSNPMKIALLCVAIACFLLASDAIRNRIYESDPHPVLAELGPSEVVRKGRLQFVRDFELGQKLAVEKQMPRFYFFTAHWCGFCRDMEKAAFTDPKVKRLADRFIGVVIDADRQPKICQQQRVTGFPSIQILSADGTLLRHLEGLQSVDVLVAAMQSAL